MNREIGILVIFSIVFVIFISGCSSSTKTFENNEIYIEYPSNWNLNVNTDSIPLNQGSVINSAGNPAGNYIFYGKIPILTSLFYLDNVENVKFQNIAVIKDDKSENEIYITKMPSKFSSVYAQDVKYQNSEGKIEYVNTYLNNTGTTTYLLIVVSKSNKAGFSEILNNTIKSFKVK